MDPSDSVRSEIIYQSRVTRGVLTYILATIIGNSSTLGQMSPFIALAIACYGYYLVFSAERGTTRDPDNPV